MNQYRVTPWQAANPPTEELLAQILAEQGYNVSSWSNSPHDIYSAHKHNYHKVVYVVSGSITFGLPQLKQEITLNPGDRLDLLAGTVHNARVGPNGVVCLEGQK